MPARKTSDGTVYWVKKPDKRGRASFAIIRAKRINGVKSHFVTVEDPRVEAINLQYQNGTLNYADAFHHVTQIRDELLAERIKLSPVPTYSNENFEIFQAYWDWRYRRKVRSGKMKRPEVAEDEFLRVLRIIGNLSLRNAPAEKIQRAVDDAVSGNTQRRIITRLRSLFKFLNRTEHLDRDDPEMQETRGISEEDLVRLKQSIGDSSINTLITLCFYSGLRPGEAYGLTPDQLISDDTLDVSWQEHWKTREKADLKVADKKRLAFLLPQGLVAFKTWVALPSEERERMAKLRDKGLALLIKKHCQLLWPDNPLKHLTLRDFRHCYGKLMRSRGIGLGLIAASMGNSERVCESYYVGRGKSEPSIQAIRQILGGVK